MQNILYLSKLENHQIRPHIKWAISDCIYVTLIFLRGLCGYVWDNILTIFTAEGILRWVRYGFQAGLSRTQSPTASAKWDGREGIVFSSRPAHMTQCTPEIHLSRLCNAHWMHSCLLLYLHNDLFWIKLCFTSGMNFCSHWPINVRL